MTTASTTFTIIPNTTSQADTAPNVGINTGSNSFNYPTYIPVQVPGAVPSKEARIVNVNMPQIVLPASTFNITVTIQTFIAQTANYTVHLTIPQLSLDHTSNPITLSNLARGSVTFTVALPSGHPRDWCHTCDDTGTGLISGQIDLQNVSSNQTDDGTPISFRVARPGEQTEGPDHHIGLPPIIVDQPPDTGGTVVILANNNGPDLDLDVHGFQPLEDIDLDLDIPTARKHSHENKKADRDGHFKHKFHFTKDRDKDFKGSVRARGHSSHREGAKTVDI